MQEHFREKKNLSRGSVSLTGSEKNVDKRRRKKIVLCKRNVCVKKKAINKILTNT